MEGRKKVKRVEFMYTKAHVKVRCACARKEVGSVCALCGGSKLEKCDKYGNNRATVHPNPSRTQKTQ